MHDIVWNHDSGWTATTNDRQYPLASSIEPNTELMEHLRGNAVSFSKKAEKEMLRSHVRMFHRVCFFYRELEHLLRSRGVGSIRALRELGGLRLTVLMTMSAVCLRSTFKFWSAVAPTPSLSRRASRMCSVPTYS